jgi:hypothetical protein
MQRPDVATGPRRNICLLGFSKLLNLDEDNKVHALLNLDEDNKVLGGGAQGRGLPQSLTKGLLEILVTDRKSRLGTP